MHRQRDQTELLLNSGGPPGRDDVYQSLAVRLIRAVELYDPNNEAGKTLKKYIFMSLRYALRTCGGSQARYGFREAPYFLPNAVVSVEALEEADLYWEMRIAAEIRRRLRK